MRVFTPARPRDQIYYYDPDHLGTATFLTDGNGLPYEFFLNLPFGETMAEQHSQTADYDNRWKFTGHELDRETGLYYAGARYYDPKISIWLSVDPLAEKAPDWTPYRYSFNNPIRYTDPDGMFEGDSTEVTDNGDGTYKVVGGNIDDGDNGIYVVDDKGNRTGEKIGNSATPYSFYNSDINEFMGTINPKDNSGRKFLNNLLNSNPDEVSYGINATGGEKYDFKRTNGTDNVLYSDSNVSDYFRGMPILEKVEGLPVFASARDVGNIGAGLVSARNGNSWSASRLAFDALESKQKGYLTRETLGSVYAQRLGWNIGNAIFQKTVLSRLPGNGHLYNVEIPKGYLGLGFKQRKK